MGFNQKLAKAFGSSAGTFNTATSGTARNGTTLPLGGSPSVAVGTLSANITTAITTSTLTMIASFQVSNDSSTWLTVVGGIGSANVTAVAAGTGSLVTTTYAFTAPHAVYAYPYVRCVLTNGVTTGGAGDTYVISYNFLKNDWS